MNSFSVIPKRADNPRTVSPFCTVCRPAVEAVEVGELGFLATAPGGATVGVGAAAFAAPAPGKTSFCPGRMTAPAAKPFAFINWLTFTPYRRAIDDGVSPGRTVWPRAVEEEAAGFGDFADVVGFVDFADLEGAGRETGGRALVDCTGFFPPEALFER